MWYRPVNEASIATPCLLLFPERIEENIRRMIAIAGSAERLRTHVKTHKIPELVKLQLQHGIQKFKCATLAELGMTAGAGGKDILLAYPLLGPSVELFFRLMDAYPDSRLSASIDSEPALEGLADQARQTGRQVDVFIDIDNGMHRTGMEPGKAFELIQSLEGMKEIRFRGLHVYDGHIHERDPGERRRHCEHDFRIVGSLVDFLEQDGIAVKEMACGGSPTFPMHADHPSRTLCPGTPLLWDAGYAEMFPDLDFLPAAVLAGRVISKPEGASCMDLGYKSLAAEMPHPRLHFLDLDMEQVRNHSEEHLVVSGGHFARLQVGELVYALPWHICPTMALHKEVYVVKDGRVTGTWKTEARDRIYPL